MSFVVSLYSASGCLASYPVFVRVPPIPPVPMCNVSIVGLASLLVQQLDVWTNFCSSTLFRHADTHHFFSARRYRRYTPLWSRFDDAMVSFLWQHRREGYGWRKLLGCCLGNFTFTLWTLLRHGDNASLWSRLDDAVILSMAFYGNKRKYLFVFEFTSKETKWYFRYLMREAVLRRECTGAWKQFKATLICVHSIAFVVAFKTLQILVSVQK